MTLTRQIVLEQLRHLKPGLQDRYALKHLWLFGSIARDEATPCSDVDLLYEVSQPIGLELMSLWDELEGLLGCKVDLGDRRYVRSELIPFVEADLINVF